jgi:iron complex outermembrane receptor protein
MILAIEGATMRQIRRGILAVLGGVSVGGTSFAQAQLEEIVVTAQRREQNVQDVGIAITAFSGDQLRQLGVTDSTLLAQQTPGLVYASPIGEGQNPVFSIRGVGLNDFSEHNEAPVAVYVDDVYLSNLAGLSFQLYDIERVEVLKGPQGTLFGRNTTGGVIHFVTHRPTDELEGYAEVSAGEFSQIRFEGALSGPLGGAARGRISALYNNNDGYMNILTPGFEDANASDSWSVRTQLEFGSSEDFELRLSGHFDRSDTTSVAYHHASIQPAADGVTVIYVPPDQPNAGCPGAPGADCFGYAYFGDRRSAEINQAPFLDLENWGISAVAEWRIADGLTLTSISAYEDIDKKYGEDTDAGPVPGIYVSHPNVGDQFSQELRLANDDEALRWTAGLYYFDRSIEAGSNIDVSGIGLFNLLLETDDDIESWAAFGQIEYQLTDQLTLIGGLRYTHEERHFEQVSRDMAGVIPVFIGVSPVPVPGYVVFDFTDESVGELTRVENDSVTWRAELDWRPADDLLLYASVSTGTKGAGFNSAFDGTGVFSGSTVDQIPYDEEELTNYEVGFKSTLLGGSTQVNAAAFYYDYKDYQAFTFDNITQVIRNLPATNYGAELDITIRPADAWYIKAGAAWLNTEVEDVSAQNAFTGELVSRDREMAMSPEIQLSALIRYEWDMLGGRMSAQASGQYQSEMYFDLDNNPVTKEDGYATLDLRVAYRDPSERFEFAVWGKNVTDEYYRTYAFPVVGLGFMDETVAAPSWLGATLTVRF